MNEIKAQLRSLRVEGKKTLYRMAANLLLSKHFAQKQAPEKMSMILSAYFSKNHVHKDYVKDGEILSAIHALFMDAYRNASPEQKEEMDTFAAKTMISSDHQKAPDLFIDLFQFSPDEEKMLGQEASLILGESYKINTSQRKINRKKIQHLSKVTFHTLAVNEQKEILKKMNPIIKPKQGSLEMAR